MACSMYLSPAKEGIEGITRIANPPFFFLARTVQQQSRWSEDQRHVFCLTIPCSPMTASVGRIRGDADAVARSTVSGVV